MCKIQLVQLYVEWLPPELVVFQKWNLFKNTFAYEFKLIMLKTKAFLSYRFK
jgi:hypothetical protein